MNNVELAPHHPRTAPLRTQLTGSNCFFHGFLAVFTSVMWMGCTTTSLPTTQQASPPTPTPVTTPLQTPSPELLPTTGDNTSESSAGEKNVPIAADTLPKGPDNLEVTQKPGDKYQLTPPLDTEPLETVVLNFDNAELHKVIKILADVLNLNYLIDPKVKGTVNLHAKGEIARAELFSLFDDIVRINRSAMVKIGPIHHIVPMASTPNTKLPVVSHPRGRQGTLPYDERLALHVIPLQYISPTELTKVIKPFLTPGSEIASYDKSRLLLFTEHSDNVETIRSLIALFDTNVFEQVKVRLYPIHTAEVSAIAEELEKIFVAFELPTKTGVGVGVNLVPIPRTNILMVITSIPESFTVVEHWLEQLDKHTGGTDIQTYIYHVRNGIAEELSEILNSIFTQTEEATGPARTAALTARPQSSGAPGTQSEIAGEIKIIPYATTNTLIIKAIPRDFEVVKGVLEELDIIPRQVLIEVMVAEVTLNENIEYGIAYSFLNKGDAIEPRLRGSTTGTLRADLLKIDAGQRVNLLAQLRAHADESTVRVLASPHLLVTDGKEASIEIGDEIAIRTAVSEGPGIVDGAAEATVRTDTGTILKVTPIINASGLVTMDIDLEKSNAGPPPVGSTDISISKRQAVTSMVVHDGETILVGGLIDETNLDTVTKVPILGDIPYLGTLFRSTTQTKSRIELVLLITPHVIRNAPEASEATAAFFSKVHAIQDLMANRGY